MVQLGRYCAAAVSLSPIAACCRRRWVSPPLGVAAAGGRVPRWRLPAATTVPIRVGAKVGTVPAGACPTRCQD